MTRRAIVILVLAVLLAGAALLGLSQCQRARTAATEAKVAKGQSGAAIESGSDAVDTVGNTAAAEAEIRDTVKGGTDEIDRAPAGDSNAAADRATCRLRSYRHRPKCIALLGPVAE